jgi:hypothetical protein
MTAAPESNSRQERFVFLDAGLALAGALIAGLAREQTSRQDQQLLQQSQPLLISTLKELEELASSSRKIVQSLLGLSGADP